jgi:hypothetical protein
MNLILPWRAPIGRRTGEPLGEVDFELRDVVFNRCHPGKHVTRQQPQGELVRVLQDEPIIGCQPK